MKRSFIYLICLLVFNAYLINAETHLVLHFDINKTLIATDKATGKSVDNILNELLAVDTYYIWDPSVTHPISYEEYVRTVLVPGAFNDLKVKEKRRGYLEHFLFDLCKRNHPLYPELKSRYCELLNKLQAMDGIVFSSFYKALNELDQRKIPYTIVLRSFGEEVKDVAQEINKKYGPLISRYGYFEGPVLLIEGERLNKPSDIYKALMQPIAIRDDWKYWMTGGQKEAFGKPFFVDLDNKERIDIFFDDNINFLGGEINIVSPRDSKTGSPVSVDDLRKRHQLVRVNALEAILNNNYYIEKIKEVLPKESPALIECSPYSGLNLE